MPKAFNSISRDAVLRGCLANVPTAYNWLRFCNGGGSPLLCEGRLLCVSHVGVHQGDACGPLGFALGLDAGLDQCEARELDWESWYLDDGHLVGKPHEVLARLQDLQEALERLGLHLNLAKCQLWGPGIQTVGENTPRYPDGLAMDHPGRRIPVVPFGGPQGITALGVPIDAPKGSPGRDPSKAPECLSVWGKAVGETTMLLERLRAYPEGQVRHAILRYGLDACTRGGGRRARCNGPPLPIPRMPRLPHHQDPQGSNFTSVRPARFAWARDAASNLANTQHEGVRRPMPHIGTHRLQMQELLRGPRRTRDPTRRPRSPSAHATTTRMCPTTTRDRDNQPMSTANTHLPRGAQCASAHHATHPRHVSRHHSK